MSVGRFMAAAVLLIVLAGGPARGEDVLFREDFRDLKAWKEVFFPKIPAHTKYAAVRSDGETFLRAESDASASLLVCRRTFDPYAYPKVRWRWKIENVLPGADLKSKAGDDVPIRIYIAFAYDPARAGFAQRLQYNAARLLYGEYPPEGSLNYVWSSRVYDERVIVSAYTDRSRMIILQQGAGKAGTWVEEEVDIIADYRKAFGKDPPARATIGIMSDSDNTKGKVTSYVTTLEVFR